jgi:hypothetical protein
MDRASLPLFFRRFIERHYDPDVMVRIDRAGAFHDRLMAKYPRSRKHNRKRFIKLLRRFAVPTHLVTLIHMGVYVYDVAPKWLKRVFKKSAGE